MVKPDTTTAEAVRVGEALRDARLELGASVEQVAEELRINPRYIAALEEGRTRDLPGPAYAIGFVRSYATALGLDADDLARRYRGDAHARPDPAPGGKDVRRGVPAWAIGLLGLVVLGGAGAAWWSWSGSAGHAVDGAPGRTDQAMPGTATPRPNASPATDGIPAGTGASASGVRPAGTVPPVEGSGRVALRATEEAWIQVRDPRSGQTVVNRVLRPGESFTVPRDGLVLTTGKAQSLEVLLDGRPTRALSGKVGLVRDLDLAPDQLRAAAPAPPSRSPGPSSQGR